VLDGGKEMGKRGNLCMVWYGWGPTGFFVRRCLTKDGRGAIRVFEKIRAVDFTSEVVEVGEVWGGLSGGICGYEGEAFGEYVMFIMIEGV